MTTLKEIEKAVNSALKKAYPGVKTYGADTIEGYERPSFFVYVTQTFSEATRHSVHKNVEIEIVYVQKEPDEVDAVNFFEKMERMFVHKLEVGDRKLSTSELSTYFGGTYNNIPCFSFNCEFWSTIDTEKDNSLLMGEINIKQEAKKWDYQQ